MKEELSIGLANVLAERSYKAKKYYGDVSILRAIETASNGWTYHEKGMGWDKLVHGRLKYKDIPCDHNTFFDKPNIKETADAIKMFLEDAYKKNMVEV